MKLTLFTFLIYLFSPPTILATSISATNAPISNISTPSSHTSKENTVANNTADEIKPRATVSHIDPNSGKKVTVTVYSEDDCD